MQKFFVDFNNKITIDDPDELIEIVLCEVPGSVLLQMIPTLAMLEEVDHIEVTSTGINEVTTRTISYQSIAELLMQDVISQTLRWHFNILCDLYVIERIEIRQENVWSVNMHFHISTR